MALSRQGSPQNLSPEGHHAAACHELDLARRSMNGNDRLYHLGRAQVHATLSLYKAAQPVSEKVGWTDRG